MDSNYRVVRLNLVLKKINLEQIFYSVNYKFISHLITYKSNSHYLLHNHKTDSLKLYVFTKHAEANGG